MNDQEFEAYMTQMDDELILQSLIKSIEENSEEPIQIGNTTIPGDEETFNQMWLAKAFDDIDPSLRLKINPLSLMRNSLHMGRYQWNNYFFKQRENLLYMSARQMWKKSEYYSQIFVNTINILTLASKINLKNVNIKKLPSLNYYEEDVDDIDMTQHYLSGPPEALMFPHIDDDTDHLSIIYSHPELTQIFRKIVLRYQHLCKISNEERTSIYMLEITDLFNKIKFIQNLMYFGVNQVVKLFKSNKYNYLQVDPAMRDINQEPNEFQDVSYKEALYKFYIYCASPELTSVNTICKAHFLGSVVIQFEEIKRMIKFYILPLSSCIRQDKLRSICCQIILAYLKPSCISEHYIINKLSLIFT